MTNTVLIIAAHSDDQIIGVGGTAAKYAKEGYEVKTIIFSKGEMTHPHFKEKIIVDTREKESLRADNIIGGHGVKFLKILEKDVGDDKEMKKAKKLLKKNIEKFNPVKIFSHSPEDPHPVHKKVSVAVLEVIDKLDLDAEVYGFDIWNPFKWDKKKHPKLIVDVTETFHTKMKALKSFKSQFNLYAFINYVALIIMYLKNLYNGVRQHTKYAEVFYRLR